MPKEGYKSLTISSEVYDLMQKSFNSKKQELIKQGIHSMSGYATMLFFKNEMS